MMKSEFDAAESNLPVTSLQLRRSILNASPTLSEAAVVEVELTEIMTSIDHDVADIGGSQ
jgi:hypothetical protein